MKLKFIESFLVLYEELNISKACKRLFITQQGLSRQIQVLEKELDVILFQRFKNGVVPTPICEDIYPYYKNMWEVYLKSVNEIEKHKLSLNKALSIGFATGLSNATDTSFLYDFQIKHPDVEINIFEFPKKDCIEQLIKKELDLIFIVNPFDASPFNCFPLAEGFMFAAIHKNHPLSSFDEPLDFSCLDGEKIITGSPQNALRELFDYFCRLKDINPRIIISSSYSFSIINTMKENIGIGTITAKMAALITNPDIIIKQLKSPTPGYMYCAVLKQDNPSPMVEPLINYLKAKFPSIN